MLSKANISYHVLRKAGVMVRLNRTVAGFSKSDAVPKEGETFKQWKDRVFGDSQINVEVYRPYKPASQTKMASLKRDGGGTYIKKIFDEYEEYKDDTAEQAVECAEGRALKVQKYNIFNQRVMLELEHLPGGQGKARPSQMAGKHVLTLSR